MSDSTSSDKDPQQVEPARPWATTLGIVLMLLSGVFFFLMLSVPWFPFSNTIKGIVGGVLFVLVQSSWWIGVAMVGPAAIQRIKSMFKMSQGDEEKPRK